MRKRTRLDVAILVSVCVATVALTAFGFSGCAFLEMLAKDPDRICPTGMRVNPNTEGETPCVCRDGFEMNDLENWLLGCHMIATPTPSPKPTVESTATPTPSPGPLPTASPSPSPEPPDVEPTPKPCKTKETCKVAGHAETFTSYASACESALALDVRNGQLTRVSKPCGERWFNKGGRNDQWYDSNCTRLVSACGEASGIPGQDFGIVCESTECPEEPDPPVVEGCKTQPNGDPWPVIANSCPKARQGQSGNPRKTGNPNVFAVDTTTRYCKGGGNCSPGFPGNDGCSFASDRKEPNYVTHTGGRMCDPNDGEPRPLRLICTASNGVTCEQGGNPYFVRYRVPPHVNEWTGRVCLASGNTSKVTGEVLKLSGNACTSRDFKRSDAR